MGHEWDGLDKCHGLVVIRKGVGFFNGHGGAVTGQGPAPELCQMTNDFGGRQGTPGLLGPIDTLQFVVHAAVRGSGPEQAG